MPNRRHVISEQPRGNKEEIKMENNNNETNSINEENNRQHYSNASGTGVLSSIIFMIVTMVAMYFLSKFMGN